MKGKTEGNVMAGVAHIEIKESPSQLHKLLTKQKDVIGFKKIQALYLFKTNQVETITELADNLGVHRVTVQKWFKKYKDQGISGLLEVGEKTGRRSVLSESVMTALKAKLNDPYHGFNSYEEIHQWLSEQYSLNVDYKTIYSLVKYKLKTNLRSSVKASVKIPTTPCLKEAA